MAELERHLLTFVGASADAYVFTSEAGTPLNANNFRSRVWNPATRSVGFTGLRFHDLRHGRDAGRPNRRHDQGADGPPRPLQPPRGHDHQHAAADHDRLIADRLAAMTAEAGLAPVVAIESARSAASEA